MFKIIPRSPPSPLPSNPKEFLEQNFQFPQPFDAIWKTLNCLWMLYNKAKLIKFRCKVKTGTILG